MAMLLEQVWQYILAALAAVVWLLRLEARANAAHSRIDVLERQRHEDMQAALLSRSEVINAMADLRKEIQVLQGDIKTLLRGHSK